MGFNCIYIKIENKSVKFVRKLGKRKHKYIHLLSRHVEFKFEMISAEILRRWPLRLLSPV